MNKNIEKGNQYPTEKALPFNHTDDVEVGYGLKSDEKEFNYCLNNLKIQDLNTLDVTAKSILIEENILTVGDLKDASLNFLLDFKSNSALLNEKLAVFQECKRFLKSINYKKGKSFLEY